MANYRVTEITERLLSDAAPKVNSDHSGKTYPRKKGWRRVAGDRWSTGQTLAFTFSASVILWGGLIYLITRLL